MTRKAYWAWELPEEIAEEIKNSKMDPKYDDLNYLLEDDEDKDG